VDIDVYVGIRGRIEPFAKVSTHNPYYSHRMKIIAGQKSGEFYTISEPIGIQIDGHYPSSIIGKINTNGNVAETLSGIVEAYSLNKNIYNSVQGTSCELTNDQMQQNVMHPHYLSNLQLSPPIQLMNGKAAETAPQKDYVYYKGHEYAIVARENLGTHETAADSEKNWHFFAPFDFAICRSEFKKLVDDCIVENGIILCGLPANFDFTYVRITNKVSNINYNTILIDTKKILSLSKEKSKIIYKDNSGLYYKKYFGDYEDFENLSSFLNKIAFSVQQN